MFITENQNIGDSILFLLAARTALANIVESSKNESKEELVSFIRNEASDYEVMHLLTQGTLPEEKYNPVAEAVLFSCFKESMLMNKDFVTEMVGEDIFDNVLNEVDSLYMVTSTAAPVLEFAAQTDFDVALSKMITEAPGDLGPLPGDPSKLAQYIKQYSLQAKNATGPAKAALTQKIAAAKKALAGLKAKGAASWKAATASAQQQATAGGKLASAAKGTGFKGATPMASGKAGMAAKLKSAGAYYGGKAAAAGKAAGSAVGKFATTKAGMATGGAAAAALAIYAGYKIYKRFFSAAAKNCAGQSGAAKTACMNKFKKQAIMKQASAIQAASGTCAKSKDPAKCKAAVGKKVSQLKAKAAAISA